jgi:membrane fusion protein (multidrug efflux system)
MAGLLSGAIFTLLLPLSGCGKGDDASGNPQAGGPAPAQAQHSQSGHSKGGGPNGPGRPQTPPVAVAVEAVSTGSIASYYAATATLEPNKEAEVLARVSGVVLSLAAEEGDRVEKGQALLQIDDSEHRYRVKQARAEHAKQQTKFDRYQKMFEGNLLSADEFETAKNDLQAAEATQELAQLEFSYTRVEAPFSGHIVRRHVDPGQTVSNGIQLFSIADLDRLLARVHVPAKEFRSIQTDQPVKLSLDSGDQALEGKIILVSPIIDPTSGTIKVTVEIKRYPSTTRPGDFAEVRIVTDRHERALLVPRTAVIAERGEQVVFVAAADSTAERRTVQTGFEDSRHIEVLAGLSEGEQVVIQGQRSLKHGASIKIMDRVVFEDAATKSEES